MFTKKKNRITQSYSEKVFSAVIVLIVLLICFTMLYPFYYIIIVSFSNGRAVSNQLVKFWVVNPTLDAYKKIFDEAMLWNSYKNTLLYTISGTAVNLIMTILCAYPLAQQNLPFRKTFMKYIVITMFFSGGMIPSYLVVKNLNMMNTIWAIIIPGAISTYNMIIMRTFFMGIPRELHESAYLDGAGELQTLVRIVLPLSIPIIATEVLFYAVGHWNSYLSALMYLDNRSKYPLQIYLRNVVIDGDMATMTDSLGMGLDFKANEITIKYAVIVTSSLPIMCVYPFLQKYFVKGVMIGSLKG